MAVSSGLDCLLACLLDQLLGIFVCSLPFLALLLALVPVLIPLPTPSPGNGFLWVKV
jgi:hypothetical protein